MEKQQQNLMTFYDHKVVEVKVDEYKCGSKLTLVLENPVFKQKLYLHTWSDRDVYKKVVDANLKPGEIVSIHAELSYYKDSKGQWRMAWEIAEDKGMHFDLFSKTVVENPAPAPVKSALEISRDELLKKMIG